MIYFTSSLGFVFVLMAGANVWLMLSSGALADPSARARRTQAHRLLGYAYVALYCVMAAVMSTRYGAVSEQVSPQIVVHMALGLLLAPLLISKILLARSNKAHAMLAPLGIAVFGVSFVLVLLNILPTSLTPRGVSRLTYALFALVGLAAVVLLLIQLLRKRRTATLFEPIREPLKLELVKSRRETHDTSTLRFRLPQGYAPYHLPGQFLLFEWPIDGQLVSRCYSISSSPTQSAYVEITPKRMTDGRVSTFLHEDAQPGLTVEAKGPMGGFYFDEAVHKAIVLVAGGSGIAPIMSILRYIDDRCLPLSVRLLYFARSRADIIFDRDVRLLEGSLKDFWSAICLSKPDPNWTGLRGRIRSELLSAVPCDFSSATFFVCGPDGLMTETVSILKAMGVDDNRIKQEQFGGPAAAAIPGVEPRTTTIEFVQSSKRGTTHDGESVLQAAERLGVSIPYSCRQGQCGTCAVRLLGGDVRMRSEVGLTDQQRRAGYVLTCVGQATGNVRLDV